MQTMYGKLQTHIAKHAYTRGKNKGDAPLDSSRRGRSHERISPRDGYIAVRFHHTDVIRAYPDGRITIDCDGWATAPTTRTCVNDALRWFGGNNAWVYSDRLYSKTQTVLKVIGGNRYAYYDGITLSATGELLSEPKAFEGKRIDKSATKELYADMQECGFKDMFKLLHAVSQPAPNQELAYIRHSQPAVMRDYITNEFHSNKWADIVSWASFEYGYDWRTRGYTHLKLEAPQAWNRLMQYVKADLYNTVKIEEDTQASNP